MKIFERLTDLLATPGVTRWNIFSYAFLVPVLFALLLDDWLGFEEAFANPVSLTFLGLFFVSQAVVHTLDKEHILLDGQSHYQGTPKWLLILLFLLLSVGVFYGVSRLL